VLPSGVDDVVSLWPLASQLGVGLVAGYSVGFALKKIGKILAVALGLVFVIVQLLAVAGFLTVHWDAVERSVEPLLAPEGLEASWRSLLSLLTFNLAFAGSFVPGLVLGLRRG
jgi:uncharacterized membrane protein (Fun14 family)